LLRVWLRCAAPFSAVTEAKIRPSTTTFSSAARGWTCGVLKPHASRKPMVMEPPDETSAGKVEWSARTVFPPWPVTTPSSLELRHGSSKLKTKSSLVRREDRSTALRARTRLSKSPWSGRDNGVAQVVLDEDVVE